MKRIVWIPLAAVSALVVGCGPKAPETTEKTAATNENRPSSASSLNSTPAQTPAGQTASSGSVYQPVGSVTLDANKPEQVVSAFLNGMRTGNAQVITGLLSTRAREEIAKLGLNIDPIGSPQAQFEIEGAELVKPDDPNLVVVSSKWLEPRGTGQEADEYEVVWVLIKETAGWRICEMAVDTHQEGEEIQVVNFENLKDLKDPVEAPRTAALPSAGVPVNNSAVAPPNNASFGSATRPGPNPSVPALPASGPNTLPGGGLPPSSPSNSGFPGSSGAPSGLPPGLPPAGGLPPATTGANGNGLPPLPPVR